MANREYEMLFKLGAQLGQGFAGTFCSAQQTLQQTHKKIQELNKLQGDVSAYQRQQAGIDKTSQKLDMYRNQLGNTQNALDVVRKEIQANGSATAELAARESDLVNKELALQNRIRDTENALSDKNVRLRQMGQCLSDAGVNTANLTAEADRLGNELIELRDAEEQAAKEADNFGNSGLAAFDAVGSAVVASGVAVGLKKIADAYVECVGASMEFESTMSTVEALSGATANEVSALSAEAKRLGAETVFTANESAQAMTYMGMAGWDANEMLFGMNGVMSLAAASGEDLALVSDIVTDNLTAFGLKAKDTAHFSDVLAAAATKSNTSVAIMGETFSGSAAIAGALGYSIEDVATAVGLMANAGVKGSVAGTALKNMFNGLLNGATLTSKAFGEVEFSAVNADGTIDSFSESMDELRGYFEQMTEAERVQNAEVIAGMHGYNGLLAILNATDDEYQSLYASINDCSGAAQRMSEIKLDNLKGDITLLESATDGFKMSLGSLYREELREVTQIGTEIMSAMQEFIDENPALVKGIMTFAGGVGAVVTAFVAFNAAKKAKNALDTISAALQPKVAAGAAAEAVAQGANAAATTGAAAAHTKLNLAMLANPAVIVTGAVIALTAGLVAWREASKTTALEEMTLSTATAAQTGEVERLNEQYSEAVEKYGETSDQARALKYDLDEATAAIEEQSFSVSGLYAEISSLHDSTGALLDEVNASSNEIATQQENAQILSAKLREIGSSSDTAAEKQAKMQPIIERLNELYPSLGLTLDNVTEKMDGMSEAIDRAANADGFQAKYKAAKDNYADLLAQREKLTAASEKAETVLYQAQKRYVDTVGKNNYFTAFVAIANGTEKTAKEALTNASDNAQMARQDLLAVQQQIEECEAVFKQYGETVEGTSDENIEAYDAVSISIGKTKDATTELLKAYADAYQAAYESVSGQYNLWTQAETIIPTSIGTINNALSSQETYWDSYGANLEKLLGKTEEVDGLRDVLASFADGSKESVNAVAGMAAASDEQLKIMVANYQKSKKEQEEVAGLLAEVKVDFTNELDEINTALETSVDKMKMDDEARSAAKATIDAYTSTLRAGAGTAASAAELVANATALALAYGSNPTAPGSPTGPYLPNIKNAYAEGTDSAENGLALVGENGPELVYMHGGEKVYTAEETRGIMGGTTKITVSPRFVINNNGGEIDEGQVSEISERLIASVMDALEQAGIDHRRSAYA